MNRVIFLCLTLIFFVFSNAALFSAPDSDKVKGTLSEIINEFYGKEIKPANEENQFLKDIIESIRYFLYVIFNNPLWMVLFFSLIGGILAFIVFRIVKNRTISLKADKIEYIESSNIEKEIRDVLEWSMKIAIEHYKNGNYGMAMIFFYRSCIAMLAKKKILDFRKDYSDYEILKKLSDEPEWQKAFHEISNTAHIPLFKTLEIEKVTVDLILKKYGRVFGWQT